ncbi:MAG: tetratricopeptide repeat protein [Bacteroidetes bacterium]|nr:tetratricopeptide repeat protein [Bacteroidota bacterium]
MFNFFSHGQRGKIDSLLSVLKAAKEDTNKVKTLYNLSEECGDEDILKYAEASLALSEKLNYKKGIANAFVNIGFVYANKGNVSKALAFFQKGLNIQQEIGDKQGICTSLNNMAVIYKTQGDLGKALEFNHKSLKIRMEIGDKEGVAYSLNNIGVIYSVKKKNAEAIANYEKSLKIWEEVGNNMGITNTLLNLGGIYQAEGDIDKALTVFKKSLGIQEKTGNKYGMALSLNSMGNVYYDMKSYKKAAEYSKKSLQLSTELGYVRNISISCQSLSKIYAAQENYKDAYEMQKLFKKMSDSISNLETHRLATKQQMQYEFQQKEELSKAVQDKKDAFAKQEKQQQINIQNTFIGGFILVLILALFIFGLYRQKKSANTKLDIKNNKLEAAYIIIEQQKQILEEKNYSLQKLLKEKVLLLKEIHHRTKNNLQIISSLLNLQSNALNDKKVEGILKQSQSRINTMAILHNKLHQTEDFVNVPISEYLQQLVSSISDSFNSEKCTVNFSIKSDDSILFDVDTAIPLGLIINELVTNAFKHAFIGKDKGTISLFLNKIDENNYRFVFSDNGIGLPETFRKNISQSLGFEIIEMLVEQLHGTMEIVNENGVRFEIKFVAVA